MKYRTLKELSPGLDPLAGADVTADEFPVPDQVVLPVASSGAGSVAGGVPAGPWGAAPRVLSPTEWEALIQKHEAVRERLTPDEKRVVDDYYRMLRDVK